MGCQKGFTFHYKPFTTISNEDGKNVEISLANKTSPKGFQGYKMQLACRWLLHPTVGNLNSFTDNGYFSPQKLVQSTYIFLKCSENYFGKFWALALMALWPLALQPLWPCWNFACFPGGQKDFCTQNFIKIHSKMTELQPVIHFCYVILFNNFARPLRLIKAMQSQMVLTCFIFWPNQLN